MSSIPCVNQLKEIHADNFDEAPQSSSHQAHLSSKRKKRFAVWDHFVQLPCEDKLKQRAKCQYCGKDFASNSGNGTTGLLHHLDRCPKYMFKKHAKKQMGIVFEKSRDGGTWKFDQETCRKALATMFILDELPFRHVEHEGFRKFMAIVQPLFVVPSRNTLRNDVLNIYLEEKTKLKSYFSQMSHRVCLTTDTWTSCQNWNYMCLTAHFIDDDWHLRKKILNFSPIPGHSAEVIGKSVEKCLISWGIHKIFCITIDNASSNDLGIRYLRRKFQSWNTLVLKGEFLHMRCCAHILSLIVKEGLKDLDDAIVRIRSAVRFVRSFASRLLKFKKYVQQEKIESKSLLCLDVETRWNSTYMMLDAALKFQQVFELMEINENKFVDELNKLKGVPGYVDWEYARAVLPFLKLFYDATLRISGSQYVTTNNYMKKVYGIGLVIRQYCASDDASMALMATRMRVKHEKYWGNINNINLMLFISVILDPRHKLVYVEWVVDAAYDETNAKELREKIVVALKALFDYYSSSMPKTSSASSRPRKETSSDVKVDFASDIITSMYMKQTGKENISKKSEMDKYLEEACESYSSEFDILGWWKVNSSRYPVLASMARDVLAIPVSTVASESAFSTRGRILDVFHSSLTPKIVEALLCAQDWLRKGPIQKTVEEDIEELQAFEDGLAEVTIDPACIIDD